MSRLVEPEGDGGIAVAVEPLLAIAGGVLGGAVLVGLAWALMWRRADNLARLHK